MLEFELVLPCYNEAKSLARLLARAVDSAVKSGFTPDRFQLVCVENGSTDNSLAVLKELKSGPLGPWFRVVEVKKNQGYGFGLWSGLQSTSSPFVGWSHADEQCNPADAFRALELLKSTPEQSDHTLVKGVRLGRTRSQSLVSRVFEAAALLILGLRVFEANAQPKVFPRRLLEFALDPPKDFAFDLYILYVAIKAGFQIKSIEVQFPARAHGVSNWSSTMFSRWKTFAKVLRWMLLLALSETKNRIRAEREFYIGLVAKLACIPLFGSSYLTQLFIPFLDTAVQNPLANPWALSAPESFPYGSVLYAILFIPRFVAYQLFGETILGSGAFGLSLVKAPLLALDILFYFLLRRIAREGSPNITRFYWLNPILFFITYIHGQLDIAVVFFTVLGLALLTSERITASAIAFAAATLCKFNAVLILPLALAFVWNRSFRREAITRMIHWVAVWATLVGLGFLPVLNAGHLLHASAGSPEALRLFSMKIDFGGDHGLYLGILLTLGLLGRLSFSTRLTSKGLVLGSGLLFGAVLLSTNTMPGWYFWTIPFVSLFYSSHAGASKPLYACLNICYLAYFWLSPELPWLQSPLVSGVLFTTLQTSLAGVLVSMWTLTLRNEFPIVGRIKPVRLAIAGDSGAGKSHLSQLVKDVFGPLNTLTVEGDDFHRWERGNSAWKSQTPLDPAANHLALMSRQMQRITEGELVYQRRYDHSTGRFSAPRLLTPAKVIITEGLHSLYLGNLRRDSDLKIFVSPHPMLQLAWKANRDISQRGYSIERVLASLSARAKDSSTHILPQQSHADWIIEYMTEPELTQEDALMGATTNYYVRYTIGNDFPAVQFVEGLAHCRGCKASVVEVSKDLRRVTIQISGDPTQDAISELANRILGNVRQITRSQSPPNWHAGYDGIHQVMLLLLIKNMSQNMKDDRDDLYQTSSEPHLGRDAA